MEGEGNVTRTIPERDEESQLDAVMAMSAAEAAAKMHGGQAAPMEVDVTSPTEAGPSMQGRRENEPVPAPPSGHCCTGGSSPHGSCVRGTPPLSNTVGHRCCPEAVPV